MTTEEALKIATDPKRFSRHAVVGHALTVLADALREAQAQTVQMREDAAKVCDAEAKEAADTMATFDPETIGRRRHALRMATAESLADAIRALPAPGEVVAVSTFSPAPAVAPVAAPKPGPTNVSVEIERLAARVAALESRLAAEEKA